MRWAEARIGHERVEASRLQLQVVRRRRRAHRVRDRLVRRADEPDDRSLRGRHAPVSGRHAGGGWFPEERITLEQAIDYYTLRFGLRGVRGGDKGTLSPGKLADLVLLSRDMFAIPPREILNTSPVYTIVGGRIVYERK